MADQKTSVRASALARLLVSAAAGVVVGLAVGLTGLGEAVFGDGSAVVALSAGWAAGAFAYVGQCIARLWPMDGRQTREWSTREDPSSGSAHLIVTAAALVALVAVAALLGHSGGAHGPGVLRLGFLAVAAVVGSWFVIHTVYTLRYAEEYYREKGAAAAEAPAPIDFEGSALPQYTDFAYFSFNLGLTFQVSDTTVGSPALRKMILVHCLLSYLDATAITATVINLVVGLAS